MKKLFLVLAVIFTSLLVFAQVSPTPVPVTGIESFLNNIIKLMSDNMGWVITGGSILVELILRFTKTQKPVSIAHLISALLNKLSTIFLKLAEILDKIFPQITA